METTLEDYITILNDAGFEAFAFDISSLKDDTYSIALVTKEYVRGRLVADSSNEPFSFAVTNRDMISDFSKAEREGILASGSAYDAEKGIYRLAGKITLGFSSTADSLKNVKVIVENMGAIGKKLALRQLEAPGFEGRYFYQVRPFRTDSFKEGEFTPLVLVGSYWYDINNGLIRFCTESEFDPDMSSESFSQIPHYYVLGVTVSRLK